MKKNVFLFIIMLIVITGCGKEKQNDVKEEKNLICEKEFNESSLTMLQTANINFIDNKINDIKSTILVTLPDEFKSNIDTFVKSFNDSYTKQYEGNTHVKVDINKKNDKEISIEVLLDYKNMTLEEKETSGFNGSEDYNINKTTLESNGYTCK